MKYKVKENLKWKTITLGVGIPDFDLSQPLTKQIEEAMLRDSYLRSFLEPIEEKNVDDEDYLEQPITSNEVITSDAIKSMNLNKRRDYAQKMGYPLEEWQEMTKGELGDYLIAKLEPIVELNLSDSEASE